MALEQARTRQRLLNFLNGGVSTVVSLARIQRVLALAQRNLHQQTILTLYPMTLLVQRQDGAYRMHQGVFNARSTRVFVDIGDVLSHPQLVQRLLRAAPPESLLFNLVANVSAVYAILVGEDFAFDPVTQVARRRLYIKYGRSVNVPSRLRDHQAVCGHAELLFMLPVPKEELVQSERFSARQLPRRPIPCADYFERLSARRNRPRVGEGCGRHSARVLRSA